MAASTPKAAVKAAPLVIELEKGKETPNTIRYEEIVPDDDVAKVRTQYLQKSAAKDLGFPARIRITIESLDS